MSPRTAFIAGKSFSVFERARSVSRKRRDRRLERERVATCEPKPVYIRHTPEPLSVSAAVPRSDAAPKDSEPRKPVPEHLEKEVKRAAVSSAVWTIGGFALLQILRFGSNLILTRLLAPDIFGVMALVNLFIIGLHMFSDFGIQQGVIYSKDGDDPEFLNRAWTLQAVRGLALWLISILIATPLSYFYGEPALQWLIPIAGAGAAISGFNSSTLFTLNRRLQRSRLVLMDVATYVVNIACVIGWIWILRQNTDLTETTLKNLEYAALAVGNVISCVVGLAISFQLLPGHRHAFRFAWHKHPELLSFGGWIVVSTMCTFLASQADRLVVGKISLHVLGVYHIAAMLANMPTLLMTTLGSYLVFPLYSRLLNSGHDIRDTFGKVHLAVGAFSALLVAGMFIAGPTAIFCLYDARYQGAGDFLQLLAVAAWFTMLQTTSERALEARGQTRFLAIGQILKLAVLPPLLASGFHYGGVNGMIMGLAAAEIGRYCLISWFVHCQGLPVFWCDFRLTMLLFVLTLTSHAVDQSWWTVMPKWGRLFSQIFLVCVLWSLSVTLWLGRTRWAAAVAALRADKHPAT